MLGLTEIIVGEGKMPLSNVQNWSNNILNLVTQRAKYLKWVNGMGRWGNIGSTVTMKYPTCVLMEGGKRFLYYYCCGENQIMDSGFKDDSLSA